MLLDGFRLEILVNNVPLPEVTAQVDPLKKLIPSPSFTCIENTQIPRYSPVEHFAAVREFGERYAIRFSAPARRCSASPIKAFLYVDGEYDFSYTDINPNKLGDTRTCFWSKNRDKIYYFKFDPTIWVEENTESKLTTNCSFGGPGSVSVYFYHAKRVPWDVKPPPDYNVEPVEIPENENNRSIKIATQYDIQTLPDPPITGFETYLQEQGAPLAVLHLHYRAASYLTARGHNIPNPPRLLTSQSNNHRILDVKIKNEEPIVIKEEPEEPEDTSPTTGKRSRPAEIIVIRDDSDDDDDNSHKAKKSCTGESIL